MRTTPLLVLLACLAVTPPAAAQGLTYERAVELALAQSEDFLAALSEEARAASLVRLATSALLPRLEITGNYTRFQEAVEFEFAEGEPFTLRPIDDWNAQATLTQPLFTGLQEWRARAASRVLLGAAEETVTATRQTVALGVADAYARCLIATAERSVQEHALVLASDQLKVARSLADAGETTYADVARARAQQAAAEVAVVEAQGAEELAYRRLARLLGLPAGERPELAPLPEAMPAGTEAEELRRRASEQRRELAAAAASVRAFELRVLYEKGGWLPRLEATAQYYRQAALFPSTDWVSGSLNLTVPIFDGGATAARVSEARANLRLAELDASRLAKRVADEVDEAWVAFTTGRAAVAASGARLEAAAEAYRVTESRYREGEAIATELLSAQDALIAAELGQVRARHQLTLATYRAAWAAGDPIAPAAVARTE